MSRIPHESHIQNQVHEFTIEHFVVMASSIIALMLFIIFKDAIIYCAFKLFYKGNNIPYLKMQAKWYFHSDRMQEKLANEYARLGFETGESKQYELAYASFKDAQKIHNRPEYLGAITHMLMQLKQEAKAYEELNTALKRSNDRAEKAEIIASYVIVMNSHSAFAEARIRAYEGITLDKTNFQLHAAAAVALMGEGKYDLAIDEWKEVLRYLPKEEDIKANTEELIICLVREERFKEAINYFTKNVVCTVNPECAEEVARAYLELGEVIHAQNTLIEMLIAEPNRIKSRIALTKSYIKSGDLETARQTLNYFSEDDSKNEEVQKLKAQLT